MAIKLVLFLVLASGKFLEALGSGIGTGFVFCLLFSVSNNVEILCPKIQMPFKSYKLYTELCSRYSLDLRSLRSSDKLTARYFSVGKKINSLLLSIENLRLPRYLGMNYYAWKMRAPRSHCFSSHMSNRHLWQLKKSKSWGPFWSYQLNSTANPAHLPQKLGQMGWIGSAV